MNQSKPTLEDVWRLFQETDRRFQETDRKFQDTDRKFQEIALESQETARRFRETERLVNQLSKNLGDIGNRLGEFVEHMVAPAVVRLFREQGIEVHAVYPGIFVKRDGVALELDLMVVNDGTLIGVECKSKLTIEHIDKHLQRLQKIKTALPIYRNHCVMGAVAAMVMSEDVAHYAIEHGLYVLRQNGEQVEIQNPSDFTPQEW